MKRVPQRELWQASDDPTRPTARGDCVRACVASIFAIDYEDTEGVTADERSIREWLKAWCPGVSLCKHNLTPKEHWGKMDELDDYKEWPTSWYVEGYWIAGVWSPRIPDVEWFGCGCTSKVEGGDPDCKWCHGKPGERKMGVLWGCHAVVMDGAQLVWDPHPEATGTVEHFESSLQFVVSDPEQLLHCEMRWPGAS